MKIAEHSFTPSFGRLLTAFVMLGVFVVPVQAEKAMCWLPIGGEVAYLLNIDAHKSKSKITLENPENERFKLPRDVIILAEWHKGMEGSTALGLSVFLVRTPFPNGNGDLQDPSMIAIDWTRNIFAESAFSALPGDELLNSNNNFKCRRLD